MTLKKWLSKQPNTGNGMPYIITANGNPVAGYSSLKEAEVVMEMYKSLQGRKPDGQKVKVHSWAISAPAKVK